MTVLLAGVRADFSQGLKNLHFGDWLPSDRVFNEEERVYSATLKAVRHAHDLMGKNSGLPNRAGETTKGNDQSLY